MVATECSYCKKISYTASPRKASRCPYCGRIDLDLRSAEEKKRMKEVEDSLSKMADLAN